MMDCQHSHQRLLSIKIITFLAKGLCNILFPAINLQPQTLVYGISQIKRVLSVEDQKIMIA
jgi:hypothetical protein